MYKPENYQNVIANLTFKDSKAAMALYETALGIEDVKMMESDSGWIMHGNFRIGDSVVFFNDEAEFSPRKAPTGPTAVAFFIYVPDVDAAYARAIKAEMTSVFEPADMFWGDRTAVVTDPFHYTWTFATKVTDPTPEEMAAGQKAMFG